MSEYQYPPPPGGNDPTVPYGQPQPYEQQPPQYGYPAGQVPQPYPVQQVDQYGRPLSDKSKLVAGLLQICLSPFAVGRFYLGDNNTAITQMLVTFATCGLGAWWPIIDGIQILMGKVTDTEGRTLRD